MLAAAAGALCSAAAQTVSLDSCRSMALHSNKQLQISRAKMVQADWTRREARSAYLPGIDFAGGYARNQRQIELLGEDAMLPTKVFNPLTGKYEYDVLINPATGKPVLSPEGTPIPLAVAVIPKEAMTYDTRNVVFGALTLTQPVYMGGKIVALNKLADLAQKLAGQATERQAENVIYGVDAAYWTLVSLHAKKQLATGYLNLLDTLSANVGRLVDAGIATKADQLAVDVKLNSARVDMVKVDNGVSLATMALAQLCGLPVDTPLVPADMNLNADAVPGEPNLLPNFEDIYARRHDIQAVRTMGDMAVQQKNIARASMLPNVAIVGAYTFSNPNTNHGFEKKFGGGFSAGVTVAVPVWHWGGNYAKYKAAETAQTIAKLTLSDAEEMVRLQVTQAQQQVHEAYQTYELANANLAKADENLRSANLAYKEGVGTSQLVMEAQTAWLKAHSEQIDALVAIRLTDTYLQKAMGRLGN